MFAKKERTIGLLSDHSPFRVTYGNGVRVLGWNILCPAKYVKPYDYYNNGFGCELETTAQYKQRLSYIAWQLASYGKTIDVIALQESPETHVFRQFFIDSLATLLPNHQLVTSYDKVNEIYLMSFYYSKTFELHGDLTRKMQQITLAQGLKNRCLPMVLSNKRTKERYLFVNVHANFGQAIIDDVNAMQALALELGIEHRQWMGDFNRALCNLEKEYEKDESHKDIATLKSSEKLAQFFIEESPKASFCFKEKRKILETRDGHMSSQTMANSSLDVLVDMNKVPFGPYAYLTLAFENPLLLLAGTGLLLSVAVLASLLLTPTIAMLSTMTAGLTFFSVGYLFNAKGLNSQCSLDQSFVDTIGRRISKDSILMDRGSR